MSDDSIANMAVGDEDFDAALVAACLARIAETGWHRLTIAAAATGAGLDVARARRRLPTKAHLLLRFGALADEACLAGPAASGTVTERLFDVLMRRIDVLQAHRAGVVALLRAVPADPPAAVLLAAAGLASMGWLLEAAGVSAAGLGGALRAQGLYAVWLWTVRAWQGDTSVDLAATMAALDAALARAAQLARSLPGQDEAAPVAPDASEPLSS